MIKAIFFARFHPQKGSRVLHQVPEGSIVSTRTQPATEHFPLFDFPSVSEIIIPQQAFCDRLITVCTNHYRVIGYPVCIDNPSYAREQFIFNFSLVLDQDADFSGFLSIVRKMANMFRNLEEQSKFLSNEEDHELWASVTEDSMEHDDQSDENHEDSHRKHSGQRYPGSGTGGKLYALCEMIFEDLNNFCECMIPIDESNTVNLKIFPTRPPPAPVYAWHVPLATVKLSAPTVSSSDLTLTRVLPFINGVSSVAQIAQEADTDINLTRKAVSHLLYYGCILLLDIFQYSAIYAPTADIGAFVEDSEAQEEAVRYIIVGQYRRLTERELDGSRKERWDWKSREVGLDKAKILQLYTSLRQGQALIDWCQEQNALLSGVDVRRFITFGIIKGFLYRVHRYAIADTSTLTSDNTSIRPYDENGRDLGRSAFWTPSRAGSPVNSIDDNELPLARFLDGVHCFDEICTELQMGEKKVLEKMKVSYSDLHVISR